MRQNRVLIWIDGHIPSRVIEFFLTDWIQEHARSKLSSSGATTGWVGAPESEDYHRRIFVKPAAGGTPLRASARAVSIGGGSSHRPPPPGHKLPTLPLFCGEPRSEPEIERADSQQQHAGNGRRAPVAGPGPRQEQRNTDYGAERRHRKG